MYPLMRKALLLRKDKQRQEELATLIDTYKEGIEKIRPIIDTISPKELRKMRQLGEIPPMDVGIPVACSNGCGEMFIISYKDKRSLSVWKYGKQLSLFCQIVRRNEKKAVEVMADDIEKVNKWHPGKLHRMNFATVGGEKPEVFCFCTPDCQEINSFSIDDWEGEERWSRLCKPGPGVKFTKEFVVSRDGESYSVKAEDHEDLNFTNLSELRHFLKLEAGYRKETVAKLEFGSAPVVVKSQYRNLERNEIDEYLVIKH